MTAHDALNLFIIDEAARLRELIASWTRIDDIDYDIIEYVRELEKIVEEDKSGN